MPASGEIDRSIDTEWEAESRSIPENNLLFHDSGYTTTVIDTEKWSGSLTPRFYARMRAGELLPHTSWRHLTQQGEVTAGSWGSHNKIGNAHYYYLKKPRNKHDPRPSEGELDGVINSSSINPHSLVQAAAAGIYSSGHDTFTFIAELHKVYDLVRNGLESIINLCTGRTPAQSWLEYRYGWRILYYDYVELSKILQELGEKERKRYSN